MLVFAPFEISEVVLGSIKKGCSGRCHGECQKPNIPKVELADDHDIGVIRVEVRCVVRPPGYEFQPVTGPCSHRNPQVVGNVCPLFEVDNQDGALVISTMKWGFPTLKPRKRPAKEGELPYLFDWWTNARNLGNNMWKPWLSKPEHRCLVPFSAFAEPKAASDRTAPGDTNWWFTVADQQVPCFAGVWKVDHDHGRVYAFCTTEPNPLVAPKHPKAMPVVLLAEDHERWLTGSLEDVMALQAGYPSQMMGVA